MGSRRIDQESLTLSTMLRWARNRLKKSVTKIQQETARSPAKAIRSKKRTQPT